MISVCFRRAGHPAYSEIFDYPPAGVAYREAGLFRGREGTKPPLIHRMKRLGFGAYRKLRGDVNAVPISCGEDLIFSCGGVLVRSDRPWVTDAEHAYSLIAHRQRSSGAAGIISRTADHISGSRCMILPWSNASKESIANLFGPAYKGIEGKVEVVYPAMHISKGRPPKRRDGAVRFLFISRSFWGKCGLEVIKAFEKVSARCDCELAFLSRTPAEIESKFAGNPRIRFLHAPLPREETLSLYRESDIFVLPTLFDTFGFVYLEAMSFSLPIIATRHFAVPEIVGDGSNGLLVEPEYGLFGSDRLYGFGSIEDLCAYTRANFQARLTDSLAARMGQLAEDGKLRARLGMAGRRMVEDGKFSIAERNRKLKAIFEGLGRA